MRGGKKKASEIWLALTFCDKSVFFLECFPGKYISESLVSSHRGPFSLQPPTSDLFEKQKGK